MDAIGLGWLNAGTLEMAREMPTTNRLWRPRLESMSYNSTTSCKITQYIKVQYRPLFYSHAHSMPSPASLGKMVGTKSEDTQSAAGVSAKLSLGTIVGTKSDGA